MNGGADSTLPVPESWTWTTAGEIAEIVGGGTPRTTEPENFKGGTIHWITPADLSGYREKYVTRGGRNITERGLASSGARLMPAGTVLFSSRAPVGYVAIAKVPVSTNQGFKSLVTPRQVSPEYLYFYLQRAREMAVGLASGTTFLEVSGAQMAKLPITLAPLSEQHRIVAAIEDHFSRLDEAVALLERVQRNLARYRASVLKAAVEGRLVPTEAALARAEGRAYEPASVLLERILEERRSRWKAEGGRGTYKEPVAPDTTDLPELPEGWRWARLDAISDVQLGQQRSPGHAAADEVLPYIRAANITWDGFDLSDVKEMGFDNPLRHRLRPGDVLLSEASGSPMEAGKPAVWQGQIPEACFQNTVKIGRASCRERV